MDAANLRYEVLPPSDRSPALEVSFSEVSSPRRLQANIRQQSQAANETTKHISLISYPVKQSDDDKASNESNKIHVRTTIRREFNSDYYDISFVIWFMLVFMFDWIGLLINICLVPNIAARYGALSGMGLSFIKWLTIMKYTEFSVENIQYCEQFAHGILFIIGVIMFVWGLTGYARIKTRVLKRECAKKIINSKV